MIDLLIDIGNSRIKLAIDDADGYEYLGAFTTNKITSDEASSQFLNQLDFTPSNVYVSSVASASIEMEVRTAIADKWGLLPVFMSTQRACCGVKNGYSEPLQLGVDRWLAMLGARSLTKNSFIVIDAGTAMTVDSVDNGKHQGGLIVPGLTTMREGLVKNAAQLREDCQSIRLPETKPVEGVSSLLATDTQSAICGGTLYMASAFVNNLLFDLQQKKSHPYKIYFTGGDGLLLSSLFSGQSQYIEDLVLLGIINVKESLKKG